MLNDSTSSAGFVNFLKKVWSDPVWSKVISTIIITVPTWFAIPYFNWKPALPVFILGLSIPIAIMGFFRRKKPAFNQDDIVVMFNDAPHITLEFEQHIYSFVVDITIKNFGSYEVCIFSGDCKTHIWQLVFLALERSDKVVIPSRSRGQYRFEKSLSDNEVKRVLSFFPNDISEKSGRCEFQFSVTAPGVDKIYIPAQPVCITMRRVGKVETARV